MFSLTARQIRMKYCWLVWKNDGFYSRMALRSLNGRTGETLWEKEYDINADAHSLLRAPDGHFYIVGAAIEPGGVVGVGDVLVIKVDRNGNRILSSSSTGYVPSKIRAYPNPSDGRLQLDFDRDYKDVVFELYDTRGQVLATKSWDTVYGTTVDVNLEDHFFGFFTYAVKSENKTIYVGKVVLE